MKKISSLIVLLFCFLFSASVSSQEANSSIINFPKCQDVYSLTGPDRVKVHTPQEYSMRDKSGEIILPFGVFSISTDAIDESKSVEREKLIYSFGEPGKAKISLKLDKNVHQCDGTISRDIDIFREQIVYLGSKKAELSDSALTDIFYEKSILFEPIFVENNFKLDENISAWDSLSHADIIVLNHADILGIFSDIEKLQRIKEIPFSKKKIFLISHNPKNFLSKVLASSFANLKMQDVSLITPDQFNTLLNKWLYSDDRNISLGERLSYEKAQFSFSMNSALEHLAYNGVSYQFLGFLLVLALVTVLFNILKQVVGLDVFGIYYPIILAIIISQLGLRSALLFIAIAIVSVIFVRLISSKIQLLFNAKKAFLISVYIFLLLLALAIDNLANMNLFRYSSFDSTFSVVVIFAILFVVEKIVENTKIFSRIGIFKITQYSLLVLLATLLLNYKELQYFLISYPDLIVLMVLVNLLIGRYMGLQLTEYIRFSPILRNLSQEE